jgi:quercetin dioxygenase-like cupin family protein
MSSTAPDRTIVDANTGETITFLKTAAETGGELVVMQISLAPGTRVPPHAHPIEESFAVLDGSAVFDLDGRTMELGSGRTLTAPPGRLHGIRNVSDEPAVLQVTAKPGAEAEYGLRMKFLMSRDGYIPTPGSGPPKHLLLGAVLIDRGGLYFPPLPRPVFRALMASLATIGRWRGRERFLRAQYPEYDRYLEALRARRAGI